MHSTCFSTFLYVMIGELKDETNGVAITKFVSGGPKNYAYILEDGTQVCKVKGLTLNHRNRLIINAESMEDIVMGNTSSLTVVNPNKIVRDNGLRSVRYEKKYKIVYNKRKRSGIMTYPYGYRM